MNVCSESDLTGRIIQAAMEVHRHLGPGLLESAYEKCLCREFHLQGIAYKSQIALPVSYKGEHLDCGYRIDLLVEDSVVVELKAVDKTLPIHEAQLLTYMKLTGKQIGLILNFNSQLLKNGIKRMVL
jgi:GxxExxY protein